MKKTRNTKSINGKTIFDIPKFKKKHYRKPPKKVKYIKPTMTQADFD